MRRDDELAAAIHQSMRERGLDRVSLAARLGVSSVMIDKILSGEVIPSQTLKEQMKEVLGIPESTLHNIVERRMQEEHQETEANRKEAKRRKIA